MTPVRQNSLADNMAAELRTNALTAATTATTITTWFPRFAEAALSSGGLLALIDQAFANLISVVAAAAQ